MTTPPDAWPEADEDVLQSHADDLTVKQTQLRQPLDKWRNTKTKIFDGSTWFGSASKGASAAVDARIDAMTSIDEQLAKAAGFFHTASTYVHQAKEHITAICDQAQQEIEDLANHDFKSDSDLQSAVNATVDAAHQLNVATVAAAAAAVGSGQQFIPPHIPAQVGPPLTPQDGEGGPGEVLGVRMNGAGGAAPTGFGGDAKVGAIGSSPSAGVSGPAAPTSNSGDTKNVTGQVASPAAAETPPGGAPSTGSSVGGPSSPAAAVGGPLAPAPPAPEPPNPARELGGPSGITPNAPTGGIPQFMGNNPPSAGPRVPTAAPAAPTPPASNGSAPAPSPMSGPGPSTSGGSGPGGPGPSGAGPSGPSTDASTAGNQLAGPSQDPNAQAVSANGQAPTTPAQPNEHAINQMSEGIASGTQAAQANPMVSPASATSLPVNPQVPVDPGAAVSPAAPGAGAAGGGVPGGGGFSGGGGSGSSMGSFGGGSSAPMPPPMPLGPPATPTPAAPVSSGGGAGGTTTGTPSSTVSSGPGVHPASTPGSAAGIAAPAPIPVSAARQERDAIAAAAAAGAARPRKNGSNDALTVARRIAAALNVGVMDFGFFWITGLTVDGTIVVANSYGLGYIPGNVNLPAQVQLVTADESIPAGERAKWATYPILAVQGWAQAKDQKLRAVIATEAQFATFDPGAAKVVLQPDDIPDSGKMEGRSRLEVIAPEAAARLASVSDAGLMELLPPAPADTQAPTDELAMLWFDLCKPLMSTMPDRGAAHLESFVTYADHAQELALYRAHTAVDATAQRAAIADWVYWQHLSVLIQDALSADVAV